MSLWAIQIGLGVVHFGVGDKCGMLDLGGMGKEEIMSGKNNFCINA